VTIEVRAGMTGAEADAARLSLALRRISRWIRRQHALPVGHGAVSALATISADGPLRLGDLATREGVAPASLSRTIAVLVADGYVERSVDPHDGRSWYVTTTSQGEQLLEELRAKTARVIVERLERLDRDQRSAIIAALPALEAMATDACGRAD
jgi:DNA-binding MarR family transcriptional regulator